MLFKVQYSNQINRQTVLDANADKILIEEQNITEGNFLIFTDTPRLEEQIQNISNNTDYLVLKQEGII